MRKRPLRVACAVHINPMMKRLLFFICILAGVGITTLASPTVIHLDQERQVIVDFGASDCWLGDFIGRYFNDTMKERAAKLLFSREFNRGGNPEGIGLSNWRVNLGAGSTTQGDDSNIGLMRRADCFLDEDGITYNWNNAAGQQYFMQKAKEYGVENILFFSNSPPIYYTSNGLACKSPSQPWGSNLRRNAYDDFAVYLATVAKHFIDLGYPITRISPVNEPQYDWMGGQEGTPWFNTEIARLVKEMDIALENLGLSTKILIPEAGHWGYLIDEGYSINRGYDQIEQFFNPSNVSTYIGDLEHLDNAVAAHSYWTFLTNEQLTGCRTEVASAAGQRGLQTFQTEWSLLEDAPMPSTGFPVGGYSTATYMDMALFMGKLIYCDLVYACVSSWSYWTAFAQEQWGQKNRFYLLRVVASGDSGPESYGNLYNGGTIYDNRNLWVLGNYSRFIRPGYHRVELTGATDLNALMGSAYVSPNGDEAVVVYVNMAHIPDSVTLETAGIAGRSISSIKKYTTSESSALSVDKTLPENYQGQEVEIPARSVVTLVLGLTKDDTIQMQGDLNADGMVDVEDINLIINVILQLLPTEQLGGNPDLNGDNLIDVEDVNYMINIILKLN